MSCDECPNSRLRISPATPFVISKILGWLKEAGSLARIQEARHLGRSHRLRLIGAPARQLKAFASGDEIAHFKKLAVKVTTHLSVARDFAAKAIASRRAEFQRLRKNVEQNGLREAARQLDTDPPILRRKLHSLAQGTIIHK